MIDLQQLKQLVTISNCGTVSKAAEVLFISQPALSRSMQRMEEDLGVVLFDRHKNKIVLNDNGRLAVDFAQKLLTDFDYYMESIKFQKGLLNGDYHIVITSEQINLPDCISCCFCEEHLNLCVPYHHKLASRTDGITFEEMDGISMLLYDQIGSWGKVREHLPNTRFIIQTDRSVFNDLIRESLLPVFTTNLSVKYFGVLPNRVVIPIKDDAATDVFYISVLKKNKHLIEGL